MVYVEGFVRAATIKLLLGTLRTIRWISVIFSPGGQLSHLANGGHQLGGEVR